MNGNNFPAHLPILDGKNYDNWCIQMKVIFRMQDVYDIVQEGLPKLAETASDAQKAAYRDLKKKDCKAIFLIHQCVDAVNFGRVSAAASTKEAWNLLDKCYGGSTKLKKVRLQTLRRQYELLQMTDQESVSEYLGRVQVIVNQMASCGEKLTEQQVVEKVLRTLTSWFDYIVVAIEESKNIEELKLEELQGSHEVH
jgi:hypothetical protein